MAAKRYDDSMECLILIRVDCPIRIVTKSMFFSVGKHLEFGLCLLASQPARLSFLAKDRRVCSRVQWLGKNRYVRAPLDNAKWYRQTHFILELYKKGTYINERARWEKCRNFPISIEYVGVSQRATRAVVLQKWRRYGRRRRARVGFCVGRYRVGKANDEMVRKKKILYVERKRWKIHGCNSRRIFFHAYHITHVMT